MPLILPANHSDVPAIDALRKAEWYTVGFTPVERYHLDIDGRGGTLLVLKDDRDMLGFVHATHGEHYTHILQLAVWEDVRHIEHGTALVQAVAKLAQRRGHFGMKARVAHDIEANEFWKAQSFEKVGESQGRFLWKQAGPKSRLVYCYERLWVPRLEGLG
jgi:ribosomal protein S18 acetylase RimI-like enzyme